MDGMETHEFTVNTAEMLSKPVQPAAQILLSEPLHPATVFTLTVLLAGVLSYVLLFRSSGGDAKQVPSARADEPEEYFQRVLEHINEFAPSIAIQSVTRKKKTHDSN